MQQHTQILSIEGIHFYAPKEGVKVPHSIVPSHYHKAAKAAKPATLDVDLRIEYADFHKTAYAVVVIKEKQKKRVLYFGSLKEAAKAAYKIWEEG